MSPFTAARTPVLPLGAERGYHEPVLGKVGVPGGARSDVGKEEDDLVPCARRISHSAVQCMQQPAPLRIVRASIDACVLVGVLVRASLCASLCARALG